MISSLTRVYFSVSFDGNFYKTVDYDMFYFVTIMIYLMECMLGFCKYMYALTHMKLKYLMLKSCLNGHCCPLMLSIIPNVITALFSEQFYII